MNVYQNEFHFSSLSFGLNWWLWYYHLFFFLKQTPNYPDSGRCWEIVDKFKVSIFYTAPTLVRSLMRDDDKVKIYAIFRLWLKVNQHCIDGSNAKEVLICLKHLDCFRYLKHLLIFFRFQLILIVIVCDKSFSQIATSPWKCGWAHQSECMEVRTRIVF